MRRLTRRRLRHYPEPHIGRRLRGQTVGGSCKLGVIGSHGRGIIIGNASGGRRCVCPVTRKKCFKFVRWPSEST